MKIILPLCRMFVFFLIPAASFSQKVKISGSVSDTSQKAIGFVTVSLIGKDPAHPLMSTFTNAEGKFEFSKTDPGNYILVLTHTGFAEKRVSLNVTAGSAVMQVDPIRMTVSANVLKEVSVKTQRPLVEQSDDKIVFNVEDDPSSKSETAIDLLRKTPFVTVDGEDNIQVNGKKNFKVLLNGRETSMFARNIKEALRGFPGTLISKIEVITSPSAKYDGEGIGGLINIITKKKVVGYNGTLSTFTRTSDKIYNIGVNGNAKVGKIGASVFFNNGHADPVWQENNTLTIPLTNTVYTQRSLDGRRANSGGWQFGNAELSFEMDSLNTLSTYANINSGTNKSSLEQTITTKYTNSPAAISYYQLMSKTNNPGISVGTDFIRKLKKIKDGEFSVRFFGEFGKTESFLNSFQDNPGADRYINNNSFAHNNQFTLQSDYILPLKKGARFETGVKGILRRASSDFESLIKYDPASSFKKNPSNSDNFKYKQDVISLYGMYSFKVKKSTFRLGTRLEHTTVNGDFISSNTVVDQQYTTLLPNLQFSSKISKIATLVLIYNKRLARPYINDLNPFVNNNDSLNISFGNPQLGPQTIHSVSAQTRFVKGFTFGGINLESNYSNNKIVDYSTFDQATGITRTTNLNIGKEFQTNLNLNFSSRLTPNWNISLNGSFRYSSISNNMQTSQRNSGMGVSFFMNHTYKFNPKFSVGNFIGMWKDPVTLQTTFPFTLWYNIAFNHKFLKDRLNVSLRAVNFLEKTRDFKTTIEASNFTTTNVFKQIRRAGALALTWNFGKLTENVSKKKGVSNDDLYSKPQPTTNQ